MLNSAPALSPLPDTSSWSDMASKRIQEIQDALSQRDDEAVGSFLPQEPKTLQDANLSEAEVQGLALKLMLNVGPITGRQIADHLRLGLPVIQEVTQNLKDQLLITHQSSAAMGDYVFELTESGTHRAHRYADRCTYFGAAPVGLTDYIESVFRQSVRHAAPTLNDLKIAFETES